MSDYDILTSSVALINATQAEQYPNVHPFRDKAFITARVSVETKSGDFLPVDKYLASDQRIETILLDIDNMTPVVTRDNDLADEVHAQTGRRILSVPRVRSGQQRTADGWMISGGMLLHAPDDSLILFERDERMGGKPDGKVIAWPKAFNNPMGRCDDLPGRTCLKEGAQEIMIVSRPHGNLFSHLAHMFLWGRETGINLAEEKALQKITVEKIRSQGGIFGIHDTGLIEARPHPAYDDRLVTVKTRLNGALRETFRAVAALSPAERILELAIPARLHDDQAPRLTFISREPFGRKTVNLSRQQLEAAHYGWAMGAFGTVRDEQQSKTVSLGGILPILQCGVLGHRVAVSNPHEVDLPTGWSHKRARQCLGL